jgi:L-rhamnono-1,4-lactonase
MSPDSQDPETPHPLATRHGITDYSTATSSSTARPSAFIYVETDRTLPGLSPPIGSPASVQRELETWAAEPLEELRYLRRIVEGVPKDQGDGFTAGDGDKMAGIIAFMPLHVPPPLFSMYLLRLKEIAGPETWGRVVGFRYLLQGIRSEVEFREFVRSDLWLSNIVELGKPGTGPGNRGWTFDIGVDMRSGGVWQLEEVAEMVERVRMMEKGGAGNGERGSVRFVFSEWLPSAWTSVSLGC